MEDCPPIILTPSQRAAAEWERGPLLIASGPGSGKTLVLERRLAGMLRASAGEGPKARFLVLALTRQSADRIWDAARALAPSECGRAEVATLNGFAADLLRRHAGKLGLRPDFRILTDDVERLALVGEIRTVLRQRAGAELPAVFSPEVLLKLIRMVTDNFVNPKAQAVGYNFKLAGDYTFFDLYFAYQAKLAQYNLFDFATMVVMARNLLAKSPYLAREAMDGFRHVLVDDLQFLSLAQYLFLVELLGPRFRGLTMAAAEYCRHSNYSSHSADFVERLARKYRAAKLRLPEAWNCPEAVVGLAAPLARPGPPAGFPADSSSVLASLAETPAPDSSLPEAGEVQEAPKAPEAQEDQEAPKAPGAQKNQEAPGLIQDDSARFLELESWDHELELVAGELARLGPDERERCAVVCGSRRLLDDTALELARQGVPSFNPARRGEFDSPPYRFFRGVLGLSSGADDRGALLDLANAFYELERAPTDLRHLVYSAASTGQDLLGGWISQAGQLEGLDEATADLVAVKLAKFARTGALEPWLADFTSWLEIRGPAFGSSEAALEERAHDRERLRAMMARLRAEAPVEPVALRPLLAELERPVDEERKAGAVRLLSPRTSLRADLDRIWLVGLSDDITPGWSAASDGEDSPRMAEERGLFFAVLTRVRLGATLTSSHSIRGRAWPGSRFLAEMGLAASWR